jgi:putative photosynthetic complex assembly protein 2
MSQFAVAVLFAVFIWWFSTGIVLMLNRMSKTAVRLSLLLSSAVGLVALWGLAHTAQQTTLSGAYCAFTCALLVWGWHELTFLTGWITGPRKTALPAGLSKGERFVQSLRAILWHELAIAVVGLFIVVITWQANNQVGTGTFLVLWVMRTSAKLNLFFGVRNLSEEFLPTHLRYLESFFKRRALNWFFPFAVTGACVVLAWLVRGAMDPTASAAHATGLALVATMLALALLEHAMLVLPVDTTALWRWALRDKTAQATARPSKITSSKITKSKTTTSKIAPNPRALPSRQPEVDAPKAVHVDEQLLHAR